MELYLLTGENLSGQYYHGRGDIFNGVGFVPIDAQLSFQLVADGKTLFETKPEKSIFKRIVTYNNTGEFFLESSQLKSQTGYFNLAGSKNLNYDLSTGSRYFATGTSWTGIIDLVPDLNQQIFLNGQKMVSGIHYNNHEWISPDITTGVSFSLKENFDKYLYTTGQYDSKGIKFQEFNAYLNGIKSHKKDFIIMGSVINSIVTGLEPVLEFNSRKKETKLTF